MAKEFNWNAWKYLVVLAEGEIAGNPVTKRDVKNALEPICCDLNFSEAFDVALKDADSAVIVKIRSWLDWYVLHQELEVHHLPRIFERFSVAGQVVFLSGLFALMFLFDRTIPSSVSYDAKFMISILCFVCFTASNFFFSSMLKTQNIKVGVANLILSSINRTRPNQLERK